MRDNVSIAASDEEEESKKSGMVIVNIHNTLPTGFLYRPAQNDVGHILISTFEI